MLIGNVFEKVDTEYAWQLCADKLADKVRDIWLMNTSQGITNWEEALYEDPGALQGLREEGFANLIGLDYVFKWWDGEDSESLAGEVDAIWKIAGGDGKAKFHCYKSWIKLARQDFLLALYKEEHKKREANRAAFREAFLQWKALFVR